MAKAKAKVKSKKVAAKPVSKAKASTKKLVVKRAAPEPAEENVPEGYTEELQKQLGPISSEQHDAFASQCAAEHADELGAKTVAAELAREARRGLKRGFTEITANGASIKYKLSRLAYLADRCRELEIKLAAQKKGTNSEAGRRAQLEAARSAAIERRRTLTHALDEVLENNQTFAEKLSQSHDNPSDDQALVDSLGKSIALAHDVLASRSSIVEVLAREHDLTSALGDTAARAAKALQIAINSQSGNRLGNDSPEVNRAEGYVLFELRKLRRALEDAHANNAVVRRYVPSKPLQKVLGYASPKHGKAKDASATTTAGSTASTPTAPGTATTLKTS